MKFIFLFHIGEGVIFNNILLFYVILYSHNLSVLVKATIVLNSVDSGLTLGLGYKLLAVNENSFY